ncbi:MAG: CapA family protein [Gammaproteobacteria bacterium]|nr:CapA family protein [Gammaproteobacteria bacterium]
MAIFSPKYILLTLSLLLLSACATTTTTTSHTDTDTPDTSNTKQSNIIKITAVGDIMLGGTARPYLEEHGYDYPFEKTRHLLQDSDIVIGNLEGPLTDNKKPFSKDKTYLFKTPASKVTPALKKAGFTIMNLANNHIIDYGIKGLTDTIQALEEHNLQYVGAGMNLKQARSARIVELKGQKIAFLAYSLTFPEEFWATSTSPGTAFGHEAQVREDVRKNKALADTVVVSFHWGREKTTKLRDYQPRLAYAAIDEGASIILGHHPHILQAVEEYKHGIILYSLGNYTFGSFSKSAAVGGIATFYLESGKTKQLVLHPVNVLNQEVLFQPVPLNDMEAATVIEHINQISEDRNTKLTLINGAGVISKNQSVAIKH